MMKQQQQRSLYHGNPKQTKKLSLGSLLLGGFLVSFLLIVALTHTAMTIVSDKEEATTAASINDYPKKNDKILHENILRAIDEMSEFQKRQYGADQVWEDIIYKGETIMKKNGYKEHLTVIEVGAQNAVQTILAAKYNFHVHCVEPSPKSFNRIRWNISQKFKNDERRKFVHLYNAAAGSESGGMLEFRSTGGTGDHVGEIDMWNMKRGETPDDWPEEKRGEIIKVPSIQLDDIIYDHKIKPFKSEGLNEEEEENSPIGFDKVYALKIDTQGYEPSVFAGLKKSIRAHKIKYIMTEYWPKGKIYCFDSTLVILLRIFYNGSF
jgi:FkbM family methyltransferase